MNSLLCFDTKSEHLRLGICTFVRCRPDVSQPCLFKLRERENSVFNLGCWCACYLAFPGPSGFNGRASPSLSFTYRYSKRNYRYPRNYLQDSLGSNLPKRPPLRRRPTSFRWMGCAVWSQCAPWISYVRSWSCPKLGLHDWH